MAHIQINGTNTNHGYRVDQLKPNLLIHSRSVHPTIFILLINQSSSRRTRLNQRDKALCPMPTYWLTRNFLLYLFECNAIICNLTLK